MRRMTSRRSLVFLAAFSIVMLLVGVSVSGWFMPSFRNPSGTYMGCVAGLPGESGNPAGDVYYTFVFEADREANPKRMTFQMYWNTYQMFSSRAESRTVYYGEAVRIDRTTWKYHLLGYFVGPHPEDVWVANDMVWIIDDIGSLTFSDDYMEVTMDYNQGWYMPAQDVDPKDGFPEGEPWGGYWPGSAPARRLMVAE
jgi:hypothetical protein